MTGVRVNEITKLAEEPDEKNHSIIFDDPMNPNETLVTPLSLKGVTSYFPSRKPRVGKYGYETIPHTDMTNEAPVWEPSKTSFSEQEDAMNEFRGEVINDETIIRGRQIINCLSTRKYHVVDFIYDSTFYKALNAKVNVAKVGASKVRHVVTS